LGAFLTGKQENRRTGKCKNLDSAGLGGFFNRKTGKPQNRKM
jgi:hypothetical protein